MGDVFYRPEMSIVFHRSEMTSVKYRDCFVVIYLQDRFLYFPHPIPSRRITLGGIVPYFLKCKTQIVTVYTLWR